MPSFYMRNATHVSTTTDNSIFWRNIKNLLPKFGHFPPITCDLITGRVLQKVYMLNAINGNEIQAVCGRYEAI